MTLGNPVLTALQYRALPCSLLCHGIEVVANCLHSANRLFESVGYAFVHTFNNCNDARQVPRDIVEPLTERINLWAIKF